MINDKCAMINDKCSGFSLIEVLVAISLMALIAVYLGAKTAEMATGDKFYKTCYMMEEIKEAIIGKPGHYCNGVQQFTGYVSDMGNLPNLYYLDEDRLIQKVTHAGSGRIDAIEGEGPDGLAGALKQGHSPQPNALWSKSIGDLPEWKFHEASQIWAGWRGPYIDPPPGGALRDAWGNKFLFVIGEAMGREGKTYRCKKTYKSTHDQLRRPGDPDAADYWEVIDEDGEMNFRTWQDLGTAIVKDTDGNELEDYDIPESLQTKQEKFYGAGCLTVISLGADNEPGGEGLDKDIQIVIDPTEYVGEVAGHVGNRRELFADKICLYYPNYTEEGGSVEGLCIPDIQDNSQLLEYEDPFNTGDFYTGINFRFGSSTAYHSAIKYDCKGGPGKHCDPYAAGCICRCWKDDTSKCVGNWECSCKSPYLAGCCLHYSDEPDYCWTGIDEPSCHTCLEFNNDPSSECEEECEADKPWCTSWTAESICIRAMCSDDISAKRWIDECTCNEYEQYCEEWRCDENIGDGVDGCDCDSYTETVEDPDPKNTVGMNIPIGIRSIKADNRYYMFSVCPGGNWIGTVRGE